MPLSWNEIKSRALTFSRKWANAGSEDRQAKPFLIDFFEIFGITDKRVASFEHAVQKHGGGGHVDLFWPGILLVEMKSRGKSLFRLYDLTSLPSTSGRGVGGEGEYVEFALSTLHRNIRQFGFVIGYRTQVIKPQDPINIRAAERMGRLHDQLKAVGHAGRPLEIYLVRLLSCLFAEDTGIFQKRQFQDYVETRTGGDGSDLGHHLGTLFYVLDTPHDRRLQNLDEELAAFPYVNGRLLEDMLPPASFDSAMPPDPLRAHQTLDRAVDAAGYRGDKSDAARVAFLFSLYQRFPSLLPPQRPGHRRSTQTDAAAG